jgi:hypothetical protein
MHGLEASFVRLTTGAAVIGDFSPHKAVEWGDGKKRVARASERFALYVRAAD